MRDRLPMIFSTTALLVAVLGATPLGEAAYNAVVPRNSVGTLQLKRNAVTSSKLAPNAVRTGQIVNASLLGEDFKSGQLPAGPKGDKGDKGDKGVKGDQGPVGISGYEIIRKQSAHDSTSPKAVTISCPAGKRVIGGGTQAISLNIQLDASWPGNTSGNVWFSHARESTATTSPWLIEGMAICAKVN